MTTFSYCHNNMINKTYTVYHKQPCRRAYIFISLFEWSVIQKTYDLEPSAAYARLQHQAYIL